MKRFLSSGGGGAPAKVARKAATLAPRGDPRTIICWNVENLKSRATQNRREVRDFLGACGADVVFLSEVKLAAHCDKGAKKGDGAPRNRRRVNDKFYDDKVQCAALLDVGPFAAPIYSLADWRYAGTCCLLRSDGPAPRRVSFSLEPPDAPPARNSVAFADDHDPDGRVIVLEYETLVVLHTYSPNNGNDAKSFERRRLWEAKVRAFAEAVRARGRSLVYVGDLNCAPTDDDLSHPAWFRAWNSNQPGKRLGKDRERLEADDEGQPGCTPREGRYFQALLAAGGLFDAFRAARGAGAGAATIEGPHFSWRGPPGADGPPETGRYFGKGMRIDHALVSTGVAVESCDLLGRGVGREGFMGSDHCPLRLVLRGSAAPVAPVAPAPPPAPPPPAAPPRPEPAAAPSAEPEWTCAVCTLLNAEAFLACDACGTPRPSA